MEMTETTIEFNFDEEAHESFERGSNDPAVGARIQIGDTYVVGGPDSYTREFIEPFVIGLLEGGLAVLNEEQYVLDYYIDAMYLVFEPIDEERVNLAFCYSERAVENPDYRGKQSPKLHEPEAVAPTRQLAEEISTAAETYLDVIQQYDPEAGTDHVEPLLTKLKEKMN